MNVNISDLIAKRDAICYNLIEADGLEIRILEEQLEELELLIAKYGELNGCKRTIQDNVSNS